MKFVLVFDVGMRGDGSVVWFDLFCVNWYVEVVRLIFVVVFILV